MEIYNNTLAVEANWLITEGIISEFNYKNIVARKQVNVIRRGCLNTPALVAYESIPERFKRAIVEKIGNPYKAVRVNQVEERIEDNVELVDFFSSYRLSDGRYLPAETRREYIANAQVLEAIHKLISDKKAKRAALGSKFTGAWGKLADAVMEVDRSKWPHTLPANPRRLEEKYKRYMKEGRESLIHKNFLNINSAKVDSEEKESLLAMLISDPRNLDNEQVRAYYNEMAEKLGWKKITAGAVAVWRDKLDNMIYARRRGASAFSNNRAMQVKRSAPTYPLYFWTMDGWDVELAYQLTENGRTTYHNRPTLVVVLDACCKYPVGYAIGTHETPELIKEALRDAAKHTESLFGQMYRTNQLQSDRYAIKKMTPVYDIMADKVTPARAHNAKAKIIEPYFKRLNKKYCQIKPNWTGFGVTSNKDLQPNADFLNKHRREFPDFEGVCRMVVEMMEAERAAARDEYLRRWGEMPTEHKIPLQYENYLMLFGSSTGNKNLLQGSGLKITIGGVKRDFDCFDPDFRNYASTRWTVLYDPQDLHRVLAVNDDETLRFVLEDKYVQPMALIERKPGDADELNRVRDYNKELEQRISGFVARVEDKSRALISGVPEINATLSKLMITDSTGQHKDRRNDKRETNTQQIHESIFEPVTEPENEIFNDY